MVENFELIIFDMDGLMFDTERVYCESFLEVARKHKIKVNERVMYEAIGATVFDTERFFYDGIPEGIDMDRECADALMNTVDNMCKNGVPKKPGLDELLEDLMNKGLKMVVATSTPIERAGKLLESAGVMPMFDFVITGAEVEKGKPFPDIFLSACERAGVSPEKALVIEDSNNGGMAAKAADIKYIIVPDINAPVEEVADSAYAVVKTLNDVLPLIAK